MPDPQRSIRDVPGTGAVGRNGRRHPTRLVLGWGITLAGIAVCIVLAASAPRQLVEAFETVRIGPALLAVILMLATRLVDAWLLAHLFSGDDGLLGFRPALRIVAIQNLSAFIAPKSGLAAAAAVLKIDHGVGLARFAGVQIASLAIKVVMTASIGLMALAALRIRGTSSESVDAQDALMIGLASLPVLVGAAYLVASRTKPIGGDGSRLHAALADAWNGISRLSADRGRFIWIIALSAVTAFTKIASFLLVVYSVAGTIESTPGVVVVSTVAELGTALSLTPGGLGVREAAAGITAGVAGLSAPSMIGIALVDRGLMLVTTGLLAPAAVIGHGVRAPRAPLG